MDLQLARQLINAGHKLPEVKDRTGVTQAVFYQIKREFNPPSPTNFGCTVCSGKRVALGFCDHHYNRYIRKPREHARIKRL